ncbi:MAG: hypothetical protein IPJ75_15895 [Ignavibacteriales bacterium]|nr:hypothetical protein [Ignavibacteriales bacterium]
MQVPYDEIKYRNISFEQIDYDLIVNCPCCLGTTRLFQQMLNKEKISGFSNFYSKNKPRFQAGEKEREINRLNQILEENKKAEYKKQQELEINRKIKEEKAAKQREADLKKHKN